MLQLKFCHIYWLTRATCVHIAKQEIQTFSGYDKPQKVETSNKINICS